MKILVFIEHDIIVRHFIHSEVFAELVGRHDVKFVFPELGHKRVTLDIEKLATGAPFRRLEEHRQRTRLWMRLFLIDQLRWRTGRQAAVLRRFRRISIGWKAALLYSIFALPGVNAVVRTLTEARLAKMPNAALDSLLDEEAPNAIIHPSVLDGIYINDLIEASKARDIPLIVIMNSWDNPSTKHAMAGKPDRLLVWGEQTRRHAIEYVGMDPMDTVAFGAAQFDVYRSAPRISREGFCRAHDIDPASKILLYAGSSKETDEFQHLLRINEAIESGLLGKTVVVYRPHPWGAGGRDGGRILDRPWRHVRIEASMRNYLESVRAGEAGMSFPDYRHTHDILSSIDALVSPLSTIILEAALHGKPVLCFLPEEEHGARHFQMVAPLTHFEDMFLTHEFLLARGGDELLPKVTELLSMTADETFAKRLERACEFYVRSYDSPYGERLAEFVEDMAGPAAGLRDLSSVSRIHGGMG